MRNERGRDRGGRDDRDRGDDRRDRGRDDRDRGRSERDRDDRDDERRDRGGRDRGGRDRGSRGRGRERGGSSRGAGYHKPENVRRRATQRGGNFDSIFKNGVDQWVPKDGENLIRFLPATWEGADHYGYDVMVHSYIGSGNSSYICPKHTFNKPCPACAEAKELKAAGEDEQSKGIAARKRVLAYVIDRDDRKPIPKIWSMSYTQDRDIQELASTVRDQKIKYLDDENKGFDVIVKKKGQKLQTRYSYIIDSEESALSDDPDVQDELLSFVEQNPIPEMLVYADEEVIAKALDGVTREPDRDLEDDDDRPRRGRDREDDDDDDRPRGRGRDRDDDDRDDTRSGRSGRGRDRDDDDDDRSPRSRGRGRDEEEDERPSRGRGRDRDEEDDDDSRGRGRSSGSGRDEDEGDRPRRRGRDDDAEDDDERPRRR